MVWHETAAARRAGAMQVRATPIGLPAATRSGATLNARPRHRGRPGRPVRGSRIAGGGTDRHGSRGGTGRRRSVPVLFRPRTGAAHRQRQPSAAVGKPFDLCLSRHDRRALDARDAGRADVPVHRPQQWAALGAAAEPRPDSVVGAVAKAPHAGQPCHRSPCPAAAAPRERRCHGRRLAAQRHVLPSAARAARRRGAEHAARHRIGAAAAMP